MKEEISVTTKGGGGEEEGEKFTGSKAETSGRDIWGKHFATTVQNR